VFRLPSLRCPRALMAVPVIALGVSCGYQPRFASMRYSLNKASVQDLATAPDAQDHILGSLEMLFGTPTNPSFALTKEWKDESFDPNHPLAKKDDNGGGEFSDAEIAAMRTDNQRRFAEELALVAKRDYAAMRPQKSAPVLQHEIDTLVEDKDLKDDERQAKLRELFENYYPSFRDSVELYRQQCLHCHGVEGGGDGPTAAFLDPHPRDYRKGIFKFTAVKDKARPRREDIYHVLDIGVYGTAMPSFRRFSVAEREGLVDYVRLLSMRGEVENRLVSTFKEEESLTTTAVLESYKDVWDKWQEAKTKLVVFDGVVPPATPEMIARGKELFHDAKKGNCASCHGDLGLGDGSSAWKLDEATGKKVSAYKDDWGNDILPRNLTQGLFRGGRRPIDIYRRIYSGINGGPMPAIGESKDAQGNPLLSSNDMWSLVHYVRSLSEHDGFAHGESEAQGAGHGASGHDEGHGSEQPAHAGGSGKGE
jgi:mono/diheme cytochrome c family protein